jgi:hypothetical protein
MRDKYLELMWYVQYTIDVFFFLKKKKKIKINLKTD